jgi:hypothetical protein
MAPATTEVSVTSTIPMLQEAHPSLLAPNRRVCSCLGTCSGAISSSNTSVNRNLLSYRTSDDQRKVVEREGKSFQVGRMTGQAFDLEDRTYSSLSSVDGKDVLKVRALE